MTELKESDEAQWAQHVERLVSGAERAERWAPALAERAARDDALNVAGMLAAGGAGDGLLLLQSLQRGTEAGAALRTRVRRYLGCVAGAAEGGVGGAGCAEHNARRLLDALSAVLARLELAAGADSEPDLTSTGGRERALATAAALRRTLRWGGAEAGPWARLGAVRAGLRRCGRARAALSAALARHLNNLMIHHGSEPHTPHQPHHHEPLAPFAPFMRWLKEMDEKTYDALLKVYVGTWSKVYERSVRAACEAARAGVLAGAPAGSEQPLEQVLALVEDIYNSELEFCTQFFCLDFDVKAEAEEVSDNTSSGVGGAGGSAGSGGGAAGGAGGAARRLLGELLPSLETELVALVHHMEKADPLYGAMRAFACLSRRVLSPAEGGGGGVPALAAAAVAAKRGADRAVQDRVAAAAAAARAAPRRPKHAPLPFIQEFGEFSATCEAMFQGARRAELDRWYVQLARGMLAALALLAHPLRHYHLLHAELSATRLPALDQPRREARARYQEALRSYVASSFGRPLARLHEFFEGVAAAVAGGAREAEVCYRQEFSKHELRKVLALYPPHEVRKSLHRLYRTVEKEVGADSGLLQVVWRAMQQEFIAQHRALEARVAACYPGAGLTLPLTTQDILDAFSDIAQEH